MTVRSALLACAVALAATLAPAGPAAASCDCSVLPSLGRAFEFAVLGRGANDITMSGSSFAEDGNVGLASGGKSVTMSGSATIDGYVRRHSGTSESGVSGRALGGSAIQDMSGAKADLDAATAAFGALAPTTTTGGLSSNTTFTGNGCVNVIRVNGDIAMGGSNKITLSGGPDDYFIFNVFGGVSFSGDGALTLSGGVKPEHVLFNVRTSGKDVTFSGDSTGNATFITPDGKVTASGGGSSKGAYYASGIDISGVATFSGKPFRCDCTQVDPEQLGNTVEKPAAPPRRGAGNASFYYTYFDLETETGHIEAFRVDAAGTIWDSAAVTALDPNTNLLKSTRDPYWDAGVELAANTSRTLYTTKAGARVDFDTTNVLAGDLGLVAGDYPLFPNYPGSGVDTLGEAHVAVVDYAHGKDAFDQDGDSSKTDMRSNALGSAVYSKALLIGSPTTVLRHETGYAGYLADYGLRDRVLYSGGGTDGTLHAFDAGQYYDPTDPAAFDAGAGEELFAYVPGLLLSKLKKSAYKDSLHFFVDGTLTAADAWLGDFGGSDITKSADEWATVLIAAFRQGGNGYIALDVTDPAADTGDPHGPYPKLLWEYTHTKLGQTWSKPVITRVKVRGLTGTGDRCGRDNGDGDCREQWVAVFGGGYEVSGDPHHGSFVSDPNSATWKNDGKAIFIVALDSGVLLDSIEFDKTGATGPSTMKYAIPSSPAVVDVSHDGFADVVYIPDLGGQLWKWDVSAVGENTTGDTRIDNWASGIFFSVPSVSTGSATRYKSAFFPPSAAFVGTTLTLAYGTGERTDLLYPGSASHDDNNRFYVIKDANPTGGSAFPGALAEANLTNVTSSSVDTNFADKGYFFKAEESEKFVGDPAIFAKYVIASSYKPEAVGCGPGTAFVSIFRLSNGAGFFDPSTSPQGRRLTVGSGVPGGPRVSVGANPSDDLIYIETSAGELVTIDPPDRDDPGAELIYWKQVF